MYKHLSFYCTNPIVRVDESSLLKIKDMIYAKEELEKFRDEVLGCNSLSWNDKHFLEKQKMCKKLEIELAKFLTELGSKTILKTIGGILY